MRRSLFTQLFFAGCLTLFSSLSSAAETIPLIFDTDIGNDCDDVLALGMIHSLQSRGECELLAVTITKDNPLAAPFVDAVNTFYGRGQIPIGVCRSGITPEDGLFNGLAKDAAKYPHDLRSGNDASQAVDVLRRALAEADDGSVVIVQVGFSTNLAQLLRSSADSQSPLAGLQLVKAKVRLLSIMAGAFTPILDGSGNPVDHQEYNVVMDIPSAQHVASQWPTPIVWSGFEIGLALPYPHQSIQRDYAYVDHHPLAEAYTLYNPPPHDRPTWDLTSVLYGVRPEHGYFELSSPGTVNISADGHSRFTSAPAGLHRYLRLSEEQKPRVTEALTLLSSQPPAGSPAVASESQR